MYRTNSEEASDGVRLYLEMVVFRTAEDLYFSEFSKDKEVIVKGGKSIKFDFDPDRTYYSYGCEFGGKINMKLDTLNFMLKNIRVAMHRNIKRPGEITVYMGAGSSIDTDRFMSSLMHLFTLGEHSDLTIKINNDTEFKVHKGVLAARCPKLKAMLLSNMKETVNGVLCIEREGADFPELFKQMLSWIYTEKGDFPEAISSMIDLLCLTDEYMLSDLQTVCELEVIKRLNSTNVSRILTDETLILPPSSEERIKEAAKEIFILEFPAIIEENPNIEKELSKIEGLWSSVLLKSIQLHGTQRNKTVVR